MDPGRHGNAVVRHHALLKAGELGHLCMRVQQREHIGRLEKLQHKGQVLALTGQAISDTVEAPRHRRCCAAPPSKTQALAIRKKTTAQPATPCTHTHGACKRPTCRRHRRGAWRQKRSDAAKNTTRNFGQHQRSSCDLHWRCWALSFLSLSFCTPRAMGGGDLVSSRGLPAR